MTVTSDEVRVAHESLGSEEVTVTQIYGYAAESLNRKLAAKGLPPAILEEMKFVQDADLRRMQNIITASVELEVTYRVP